jgi:DNA-directed RNA polymerase N-terminal
LRLSSSRKAKAVSVSSQKGGSYLKNISVSLIASFPFSGLRPWQHEELKKMYRDSNFRKTRQKLNQLVDEDVWSSDTKGTLHFYHMLCLSSMLQLRLLPSFLCCLYLYLALRLSSPLLNDTSVKVGAALISFLLDSAKTDRDTPAFQYAKKLFQKGTFKRVGILQLENAQYLEISGRDTNNVAPRHLPMLVPPKLWDNRNQREGCYYRIRSSMMRTNSRSQTDALRRADMGGVLSGLDYLGESL